MPIRSPSPSQFRPQAGIDQSALEENRALVAAIGRRSLLRGSFSLGALAMLTGCDVTNRDAVQAALRAVSSFNDRARHFYETHGYVVEANFKDYVIPGASELLMHKRLISP